MSQKRKFEEFHDPDYPQNDNSKRKCTRQLQPEERIEKIQSIVRREFQNELSSKEQELIEINERIGLARKLLHKVRYAAVYNFYTKKQLEYSTEDAVQVPEITDLPAKSKNQKAIHPALKSILGKKGIDYEQILKIRPTREAAKTAKHSISEKLKSKKDKKSKQTEVNTTTPNEIKVPRQVESVKKPINVLNSGRAINQTKHLIVVGNTSKYIGNECEKSLGGITHKWLIYIQSKTTVAIEKIVNKVRFFLHPSYKPNDIVDVCSPPFQLSRRGWGEFPVRIQLFLHPKLQQKPLQFVHNLVLDKTLSGLQTMGAETLVEIWLRSDLFPLSTSSTETDEKKTTKNNGHMFLNNTSSTAINSTNLQEKSDAATTKSNIIEDNLMDFLNKIENQSPSICSEGEKIEPTIADSPIIDHGIIPPSTTFSSVKIEQDSEKNVTKVTQNDVKESNSSNNLINPQISSQTVQNLLPTSSSEPCKNNENNKSIQVFQTKLFKCIDKQGNVKFLQMLIKQPESNGQIVQKSGQITQNGQVPPGQKAFLLTKLNGQNNSGVVKPPLFKILTNNTTGGNNLNSNKLISVNNFNNNSIKLIQNVQNIPTISGSQNMEASIMNHVIKNEQTAATSKVQNTTSEPTVNVNSVKTQLPPPSMNLLSGQKAISNSSKKQVFLKDGKMYIIDPLQSKLKQQSKKQESLLKPQVSLLKPIVKNDNVGNCIRNNPKEMYNHTAIATDHDYTSLINTRTTTPNTITITRPPSFISQRTNIVTVNSPNNTPVNVFVTQKEYPQRIFPISRTQSISKLAAQKRIKTDYAKELEDKFMRGNFSSVRHSVEFLLKRLPLIKKIALSYNYRTSFPFVVCSESVFRNLPVPKQKANEWLRAKYINKLLLKHSSIKAFKIWSTKEIIIFSRQHAYSPVIENIQLNFETKDLKSTNNTNLSDFIKKEIKKEKIEHQTLTPIHDIHDWINKINQKLKINHASSEDIIDVENYNKDDDIHIGKFKHESPIKNYKNKCWLQISSKLEKESEIVSHMCQDIGIRLKPEEILPDVMHSASQTVLAHSLRCFIEDLLRRALATKKETETTSTQLESSIQPDDIRNAICNRPQFDFLSNKNLGILKVKDKEE